MTYAEYCKTKCEGCRNEWPMARGIFRLDSKPMHEHEFHFTACTAPTRDQFEQFLNEKYDAAFNEGTYLHKCLEQASLRIAELERENAELRKDKVRLDFVLERRCRMPIESTNGWIVQEWVGHTTGRGDSPRAALDAAMHRAGEQK